MNRSTPAFRTHAKLVVCISGLVALLTVPAVQAAEPEQPHFVMNVVAASEGADHLVAGDARSAIVALEQSSNPRRDRYARSTNLCVAHTLQGDFDAAERHCDQAVRLSQFAETDTLRGQYTRVETAMALSNRGVLRALDGRMIDARRDLERASRYGRASAEARSNLRRLGNMEAKTSECDPHPRDRATTEMVS